MRNVPAPTLTVVSTDGMAGLKWLTPAFCLLTESGYETQAEFTGIVAEDCEDVISQVQTGVCYCDYNVVVHTMSPYSFEQGL